VSTVVLFCLCGIWSMVTPIGANNDEGAQMTKAASVVRGQIVGPSVTPALTTRLSAAGRSGLAYCRRAHGSTDCDRAVTVVSVPESFAHFRAPSCFLLQVYGSGCSHGLQGSGREVSADTYVGRYPPLYYVIVGLPSLVWHTSVAVYLMRLLSSLLTALMLGLALALTAVWGRSRMSVLAVAVAATPTVLIFGSAVNPSGLEMAASLCVWAGGLLLVLDHAKHPPPSLVYATAAAAIVLVLTRGLSPFWLAVIAASLVALAPRSLSALVRSREVRVAGVLVALAGACAVGYIVWAHTLSIYPLGLPVPASLSVTGIVELALGRTQSLVTEFIGTFDAAESQPPLLTIALWLLTASSLVVFGLVASLRRHVAVLVALIAAALIVPTAIMVSQAHHVGLVWQARDGFPLYVGIVLVAGAIGGRNLSGIPRRSSGWSSSEGIFRRLAVLVGSAIAVAQLADLLWALRRYTVGLGTTVNPLAHVPEYWDPPLSAIALILTGILAAAFYGWWIVHLATGAAFQHARRSRPRLIANGGNGSDGPGAEPTKVAGESAEAPSSSVAT
jgi:hypothetical protein